MGQMAGGNFGIGPVAPEQIGPSRSPNSAAGILVEHKAAAIRPAVDLTGAVNHRFFCLDICQGSRREQASIQCDGSARRQQYIQIAKGAFGLQLEKDIAGVVI